jgi:tRNA(Ile)-lysidine synthase
LQPGFDGRQMYHRIVSFPAKIAGFVRKHGMIRPGDRVGVAVSGGADSVALLRALVEFRGELGCVLSVVHFNHKIRGNASDEDAEFVQELSETHGLRMFLAAGDAKKFGKATHNSIETSARMLRYGYFDRLVIDNHLDKVATAHTLSDQAETVLLRLLRGAGSRGIVGIYPDRGRSVSPNVESHAKSQRPALRDLLGSAIIRPLLNTSRREVETYLRSLEQPWREDSSNRNLEHTRNRVRHVLLPLLEKEFNPSIAAVLANTAEIARVEEEYWENEVKKFIGSSSTEGCLNLHTLLEQPLAVRRRAVREAFHQASGKSLDFEHTDELVRFLERRESSRLQLPEYWFAVLDWPKRRVTFEERAASKGGTSKAGITSKSKRKDAHKKAGPSLRSG